MNWQCTGRDLQQCEDCKRNVENRPPHVSLPATYWRPLLNGTQCIDYKPQTDLPGASSAGPTGTA